MDNRKSKPHTLEIKSLFPGLSAPVADVPCQLLPWPENKRFQNRIQHLLDLEEKQRTEYADMAAEAHRHWQSTSAKNPQALAGLLLIHYAGYRVPLLRLPLEIVPSGADESKLGETRVTLLVYDRSRIKSPTTLAMVSSPKSRVPSIMGLKAVGPFLWNTSVEWDIKLSDLPGHRIALNSDKCQWAVDWTHDALWSTRLAKALTSSQSLLLLEQHFGTTCSTEEATKERVKALQRNPSLINEILLECHNRVVQRLERVHPLKKRHWPKLLGEEGLTDCITLHHLLGLYAVDLVITDQNGYDCLLVLRHRNIPSRYVHVHTALATLAFSSKELVDPKSEQCVSLLCCSSPSSSPKVVV